MKNLIILAAGIAVFIAIFFTPILVCDFIIFGLRFLQSL